MSSNTSSSRGVGIDMQRVVFTKYSNTNTADILWDIMRYICWLIFNEMNSFVDFNFKGLSLLLSFDLFVNRFTHREWYVLWFSSLEYLCFLHYRHKILWLKSEMIFYCCFSFLTNVTVFLNTSHRSYWNSTIEVIPVTEIINSFTWWSWNCKNH